MRVSVSLWDVDDVYASAKAGREKLTLLTVTKVTLPAVKPEPPALLASPACFPEDLRSMELASWRRIRY